MAKKDECKSELVFPVVFYPEGKWILAWCPVIDEITQGKTLEEAKENIKEVIDLYMEDENTPKNHLI